MTCKRKGCGEPTMGMGSPYCVDHVDDLATRPLMEELRKAVRILNGNKHHPTLVQINAVVDAFLLLDSTTR